MDTRGWKWTTIIQASNTFIHFRNLLWLYNNVRILRIHVCVSASELEPLKYQTLQQRVPRVNSIIVRVFRTCGNLPFSHKITHTLVYVPSTTSTLTKGDQRVLC